MGLGGRDGPFGGDHPFLGLGGGTAREGALLLGVFELRPQLGDLLFVTGQLLLCRRRGFACFLGRAVRRVESGSGLVVDPLDVEGFAEKSEMLRVSPDVRGLLAENALRYARQTFNLERIADRFESLFDSLLDVDVEDEEFADERS